MQTTGQPESVQPSQPSKGNWPISEHVLRHTWYLPVCIATSPKRCAQPKLLRKYYIDDITLVNLHWLPVTYRVNFKIAMLAHKCIYGNAPEYLKDLIKVKSTTRYNLRSDGEMLLEDYSARSKKTLGDRTFKVAAPRIWNILPKDIRKQDNYYAFKKQLKTYYFKLAYNF